MRVKHLIISLVAALFFQAIAYALPDSEVNRLIDRQDLAALKQLDRNALEPLLIREYQGSAEDRKATIAWIFYSLAWKSEALKEILLRDVHTQHQALRLQVQWALGRVSNAEEVVSALVDNMRNDPNPLFRDKAACALASDQIHLSSSEKAELYQKLIASLDDEKLQVRDIAGRALQIATGQTKGYDPAADPATRAKQIGKWQEWLLEYKANLD